MLINENETKWKEAIQIEGFDDVAEDLLKGFLQLDPSKRISVEEALAHGFFKDFQSACSENK